ncbi:hypothetical protein [Flavobacterium flavigenum]|uniref:hypothetical protein n=1 Tax=Flavobacterium flavigenum TaxID=3003258 RepID=UPI0022AC45AD|nr:hypothetical protein [Flavobacterium flavigenum]
MTREKFIENFKLLLVHLHDLTEEFCFNEISKNYKFVLEPSGRNSSEHLTKDENEYLKTWNELENREISFDQVAELLYKNGKTPKWADCNIELSSLDKTVVKIFFSRQFKDESEIYYLEKGTGPFKAVVNIPYKNIENPDEKFDVNWKANLEKSKTKNIFSKLKYLWFK